MSNTDFILRISDGVTALDLTPSFDTKIQKEVITSEARTKAGSLFRYKWADFDSYEFELENVSAYNAAIVNRWHKDNSSLSLSFGTALDIDAAFYFPLDESSGSLAYDLVNSYCLTFSGSIPDVVNGFFGGKARQFYASSGNVGISTAAISGLTSNCDMWFSFLFGFTDTGTYQGLPNLYTYNANMNGSGLGFTIRDSLFIRAVVGVESGAQSTKDLSSWGFVENNIYQLMAAYRSGAFSFFLKNHTVNTLTCIGSWSTNVQYYDAGSVFLTVGKYSVDSSYYPFNDVIDEIRGGIQTLTDDDIVYLMTHRIFNPGLPIKQGVMITSDKSPFNEFAKPYTTEFNGTLELEEI